MANQLLLKQFNLIKFNLDFSASRICIGLEKKQVPVQIFFGSARERDNRVNGWRVPSCITSRIGLPLGLSCYLIFGPLYPVPNSPVFILSDRDWDDGGTCACVSERERERVCVCECVWGRERERIIITVNNHLRQRGPASLRLQPVVSIFFPTQKQLMARPIASLFRCHVTSCRPIREQEQVGGKKRTLAQTRFYLPRCAGEMVEEKISGHSGSSAMPGLSRTRPGLSTMHRRCCRCCRCCTLTDFKPLKMMLVSPSSLGSPVTQVDPPAAPWANVPRLWKREREMPGQACECTR